MLKKNVPVTELRFGMYVSQLDRPWTDTPFAFQGFVLQTEAELEILKGFCKWVVVDEARSAPARQHAVKPVTPRYAVQVPVEAEVERATLAQGETLGALRDALNAVRANQTLDARKPPRAAEDNCPARSRHPAGRVLDRADAGGDGAAAQVRLLH